MKLTGNLIPIMTANTSPSGTAIYSTQSTSYLAWRAFNNNIDDFWQTSSQSWTSSSVEWLGYVFPSAIISGGYSLISPNDANRAPKAWKFQGSNNGASWVDLDTRSGDSIVNQRKAYIISNTTAYTHYRVLITSLTNGYYPQISEMEIMGLEPETKFLVYSDGFFQKYDDGSWMKISELESEAMYLMHGMDSIDTISESAWSELTGNVELCYWTDDPNKTEVQFNIETEPFTLEDEFQDKTIKIIEYTDDPTQTESTITLDTEPFDLYDELGDSVEVLYYTDDPSKIEAELELIVNYSPLDEIDGDFEVVTWTDDVEALEKNLIVNGLPIGQMAISPSDLTYFGDIQSLFVKKLDPSAQVGKMRFVLSFDSGKTWHAYKYKKWTLIDTSNSAKLVKSAMRIEDINKIPKKELKLKLNDTTRIGYYIEEDVNGRDESKISSAHAISMASVNDVKFDELAFYLLNTTATIKLDFKGNKVTGVLDDADKGKVKYRVILNGEYYHPKDGKFTQLMDSPHNVNIVIDDRSVNFGVQNTLKVEFQDYWGQVDSWDSTFIGSHSGLLFSDPQGNLYTTSFGEVLQRMDFGQIIAGQTTLDQKVMLSNKLGYDVRNVRIDSIQPEQSGVKIELSKEQSPFIEMSNLIYPDTLLVEESIEFFVRISTLITSDETPSGKFEIRVSADKVDVV